MIQKKGLEKSDTLSNEYIYDWAVKLGEEAAARDIPLRLLGATAFIYHCPKYRELYFRFGRRLTDVDVMTYSNDKAELVDNFLNEMGFKKQNHYIWHASTRDLFINDDGLLLDVFRDKLEFCHTIHFKNRLEMDSPTIPLEEMVLQKLQIVTINDKDFKDLSVLFLEHDLNGGKSDTINGDFIAAIFAKSWGFYHTATINLEKFKDYLDTIPELTSEDLVVIRTRVDQLLAEIESKPKSLKWKLRSKIGTRMSWYQEVEEIER